MLSQIDLSDAFLQVKVDEQYRDLLAFTVHRGLYFYNRILPGVEIAHGVLQKLIDIMLVGLKGTSGYLDVVNVGGETEKEQNHNLQEIFQRIQDF